MGAGITPSSLLRDHKPPMLEDLLFQASAKSIPVVGSEGDRHVMTIIQSSANVTIGSRRQSRILYAARTQCDHSRLDNKPAAG